MYIKCFMLCLSSALSRRVGALQISLISFFFFFFFSPDNYRRGICSGVVANFGLMDLRNFFLLLLLLLSHTSGQTFSCVGCPFVFDDFGKKKKK